MPHVVVTMLPGRTEAQKSRMAEAVTQALVASLGCGEGAVSVAIEEVASDAWDSAVYEPAIAGRRETLYKLPGYGQLSGD